MKLAIGFITYGDEAAKYLPYFLNSLKQQDLNDCKIIALDNSENKENKNIRLLRDFGIEYEQAGANLGFARGYNRLIRRALYLGAEYFLALNYDMILEPGAIQKMIGELDRDRGLASACPKTLKWEFNGEDNKKTNIIDTCGIIELSALRFAELGQGQTDKGQCGGAEILGPSGAAAMYRLSALEQVKERNDYFDELMFMYKEDADLAYRLKLAGFGSKCVCDSIVYHDRTAAGRKTGNLGVAVNRRNKSRRVNEWSFLNQHIIFVKYWRLQNFRRKAQVLWHAFKMFVFVVLFEQYLLKQYLGLWQLRKKIKVKSKSRQKK